MSTSSATVNQHVFSLFGDLSVHDKPKDLEKTIVNAFSQRLSTMEPQRLSEIILFEVPRCAALDKDSSALFEVMKEFQPDRVFEQRISPNGLSLIDAQVLEAWCETYGSAYFYNGSQYGSSKVTFPLFLEAVLDGEHVKIDPRYQVDKGRFTLGTGNFASLLDLAKRGKDRTLLRRLFNTLTNDFTGMIDAQFNDESVSHDSHPCSEILYSDLQSFGEEDEGFIHEFWDNWEGAGQSEQEHRISCTLGSHRSLNWMDSLFQRLFAERPLEIHCLNRRVRKVLAMRSEASPAVTFKLGSGRTYIPQEFTGETFGSVRCYQGLGHQCHTSRHRRCFQYMPFLTSVSLFLTPEDCGSLKRDLGGLLLLEHFHLDFRGKMTDKVLEDLCELLTRWPLQSLVLTVSPQSAGDVKARLSEVLPKLRHLKRLELSGIDLPFFRDPVGIEELKIRLPAGVRASEEAAKALRHAAPRLKTLSIEAPEIDPTQSRSSTRSIRGRLSAAIRNACPSGSSGCCGPG